MKKRDWTGGSAFKCCFNFAFLPSAWIKARAWPADQTANISLRRRWEGSGKFYRAWRRTANAPSGLLCSPFLALSRIVLYYAFHRFSEETGRRSVGEKCRSPSGKSAKNFVPDYGDTSSFRLHRASPTLTANRLNFKDSSSWMQVVTWVFMCFQLHVGITTVTAARRDITVASEWFMISNTRVTTTRLHVGDLLQEFV